MPREVAALKEQPGRDIMVFGSGSIASLLTEHDLVDEYQLIVNPILLGGGQSLMRGVSAAAEGGADRVDHVSVRQRQAAYTAKR